MDYNEVFDIWMLVLITFGQYRNNDKVHGRFSKGYLHG
jgi:hypothetical protein